MATEIYKGYTLRSNPSADGGGIVLEIINPDNLNVGSLAGPDLAQILDFAKILVDRFGGTPPAGTYPAGVPWVPSTGGEFSGTVRVLTSTGAAISSVTVENDEQPSFTCLTTAGESWSLQPTVAPGSGYQITRSGSGGTELSVGSTGDLTMRGSGSFDDHVDFRNGAGVWRVSHLATANTPLSFSLIGTGFEEMRIESNGDFYARGEIFSQGVQISPLVAISGGRPAFNPEYPLVPVQAMRSQVMEQEHLRHVSNDIDPDKGVNLTQQAAEVLLTVEELHLYVFQAIDRIAALEAANADLLRRVDALESA